MRVNRKSICIKYILVAVWCAGGLLLGGCSDTGEGTWKQEYENCVAAMEQGISEHGMAEQQGLENFQKEAWDQVMELWQDSLSAFGECVKTCVENRPGGMEGEEDVYRTATFLMAAMCEENGGSYEFRYGHGEDMEKAQEDFFGVWIENERACKLLKYQNRIGLDVKEGNEWLDLEKALADFKAVIERENPIDESWVLFMEEYRSYYDIAFYTSAMRSEAWQGEFYHCLNTVRDRVRQDPENKQKLLELLEALEDFIEIWAEDEERYDSMQSGSGMGIFIAADRANVFRIGTLLLIDGLERSGGSYEFIYDREPDRQELIHIYEGEETDAGAERMYDYKISVYTGIGFDSRQGIVISPGNEDLEDGGEWFLFERDNGIIVRQKIDHEKYPYCYYQFPCEEELYGPAICAYGKNEDCYFISWEDNDYLVVTRREEGQVEGIAVYQRYSASRSEWYKSRPTTGWIMGLEKTSDGEIQVTLYTYVYTDGYAWGKFLDY